MITFRSKDLQRIANASRTQVARWSERGLIAVYKDARGRGKQRMFSEQNAAEAILCKQLSGLGMDASGMLGILDYLRGPCFFELADPDKKWSLWQFAAEKPQESKAGLFLGLGMDSAGSMRSVLILKKELVAHFFHENPVCIILNLSDVLNRVNA
jgi:hypothetical protein